MSTVFTSDQKATSSIGSRFSRGLPAGHKALAEFAMGRYSINGVSRPLVEMFDSNRDVTEINASGGRILPDGTYVNDTGKFLPRISYVPEFGTSGLLIDPVYTNLFPLPFAPASQTFNTPALVIGQVYAARISGSGSATFTIGGITKVVTEQSPGYFTFAATAAVAVGVVIAGSVTWAGFTQTTRMQNEAVTRAGLVPLERSYFGNAPSVFAGGVGSVVFKQRFLPARGSLATAPAASAPICQVLAPLGASANQGYIIAAVNRSDGIRLFESLTGSTSRVMGTPGMPPADGYTIAAAFSEAGIQVAVNGVLGPLYAPQSPFVPSRFCFGEGTALINGSSAQIVSHFAAYDRGLSAAELLAASKL